MPCFSPARPLPTRAAPARGADVWLRADAPALRAALRDQLEGDGGRALARIAQLQPMLADYARRRWGRLAALDAAARRAHLASLHPILHLLDEDQPEAAWRMLLLRLGGYLERLAAGQARRMRMADPEGLAAEAVWHLAEKVRRGACRLRVESGDAQRSLAAWCRRVLRNFLLDRARRHSEVLGVEDLPEPASAEPLAIDRLAARERPAEVTARLRDARAALDRWEAALREDERRAYESWLRHDSAQSFWAALKATQPALCRCKNRFYRRLAALGEALGGGRPQREALRALRAIDLGAPALSPLALAA